MERAESREGAQVQAQRKSQPQSRERLARVHISTDKKNNNNEIPLQDWSNHIDIDNNHDNGHHNNNNAENSIEMTNNRNPRSFSRNASSSSVQSPYFHQKSSSNNNDHQNSFTGSRTSLHRGSTGFGTFSGLTF